MAGPAKRNTKRKLAPEVAAVTIPTTAVDALRDRTWAIAGEWADAGWPWMSTLIKGAVALSKAER
jgi:hypothetical protein